MYARILAGVDGSVADGVARRSRVPVLLVH
jgi:nucleotide-binding universal stress UspA family protein